jgi:hypothetical protein
MYRHNFRPNGPSPVDDGIPARAPCFSCQDAGNIRRHDGLEAAA